ncbi:MAG: DNA topoisomerase (ATP-hydrolyzing) subunit B [Chlorobi bacterium CHB2]|nr:DNA topoisomerase (ATP-hydrolyzing) subunit B [Chlorobi bacterium CHB2]
MADHDVTTTTNGNGYSEDSIKVLEGLEAVRKRPAMYIGDIGVRGLHHLVYEVVDNSIDEALAGRCDTISVTIHKDNSITVSDNGSGIPVGMHPTQKISTLQVVMTILHAGGKFDKDAYKVSGGLHGVGVSVVNALSEHMISTIKRDGKIYRQEYRQGTPQGDVVEIGTTSKKETGTTQWFRPDSSIFKNTEYRWDTLAERMRELAFLNPTVTITMTDEREDGISEVFHYKDGLVGFVKYIDSTRTAMIKPVMISGEKENTPVEICFQYNSGYSENVFSYVNDINTHEGGTHVSGFRSALTRTLNAYAQKNKLLKNEKLTLTGEDFREGLTAVISIKVAEPQFEGQTKTKLGNSEVDGIVRSIFGDVLTQYLEENPKVGKAIIDKVFSAAEAREAARKSRELVRRKNAMESMTLPGKLADCSIEDPEHCEIFLVEGDSAGGCFSGDTKIALADGRNLNFFELLAEQEAGKENFCYTIRHDGTVGLERIINVRMTKANAEVIRVTLDNGKQIVCTPDHRFMLRDGSYKAAAELRTTDSLMPLHRKFSDMKQPGITINGYEMVWNPKSDSWLFTHKIADWYNLWKGTYTAERGNHCHHIDFNKRNNNPTNIIRMMADEHLNLHRRHVTATLHRSDAIQKWRESRGTQEYREKMSLRMKEPATREMLSNQAKAQWANPEYKQFMVERWREFYQSNVEYQRVNRQQLLQAQRTYWSDQDNREKQSARTRTFYANHPEAISELSKLAKEQWQNEELKEWRRKKTSEQWTPEFREKRRAALARTYYNNTLAALKEIEVTCNALDLAAYRNHRIATRNKSLLSFETFCQRYFNGDTSKAVEAVQNYNHRIVKIERLDQRMDVYDLEVPTTHNFALPDGVFVHNSAKSARDRRTQAILPLRGKVLNVQKARINKVLENEEIRAIFTALGVGFGETLDISKARYGKVILMADADVDGAHIRTLLLTLFFNYMREMIEEGKIYLAMPPLYKVKKGKGEYYAYDEAERDEILKRLRKDTSAATAPPTEEGEEPEYEEVGRTRDGIVISRFKGLGEMNPEQLWATTMNPDTRTLQLVTIENAQHAAHIFETLMGDSVEPRRQFIERNARYVRNLDV